MSGIRLECGGQLQHACTEDAFSSFTQLELLLSITTIVLSMMVLLGMGGPHTTRAALVIPIVCEGTKLFNKDKCELSRNSTLEDLVRLILFVGVILVNSLALGGILPANVAIWTNLGVIAIRSGFILKAQC